MTVLPPSLQLPEAEKPQLYSYTLIFFTDKFARNTNYSPKGKVYTSRKVSTMSGKNSPEA